MEFEERAVRVTSVPRQAQVHSFGLVSGLVEEIATEVGHGERDLAALGGEHSPFLRRLSRAGESDDACQFAVRCALVATPDSCLSSVPLSGAEAVEWIRIALQVLGRS